MITSERSGQIQALKNELAATSESAKTLFFAHTENDLLRSPAKGGWSAAECLEHLTITSNSFLPTFAQAREKAVRESLHSPAPYSLDIIGRIFVKILEPPVRFGAPAPPQFLPATPTSAKTTLEAFLDSQNRVMKELDQSEGISMVNVKVTSPANSLIKYNLYSAYRILTAHQRRHLAQAGKALPQSTPLRRN